MVKIVITRDNNEIAFDKNRIIQAIEKAFRAVNTSVDKEFCINAANSIEQMQETELTVNDIQNLVEESLMKSKYDNVAKAYIIYRKEREVYRKRHAKQMVTYNEIIDVADTNVKNDNANINGNTPAGQMMKFASETTKPYALDYLLNQSYANAHEKGIIHIHDLDYYPTKTTTCVQHDLNKLFKNGFDTGHGYLREPQSIRSYGALAAISFQANQNEQHGGQSIPAFDHYMAPGVLKSFIKLYKNNLKKVFEIHYFMQFLCGKDEGDKCMDNVLSKLNITTINRDLSIADQLISIIRTDYAEAIANTDDFEPTLDDTIRHYDELAYKFAYKETVKETNQSMEAFLANMNSMHSRGGGQIVFSSVNYGTDFSPEGRLVTSSLLLRLEEGLGRGETPIFPIHIFKVKEGLNFSKEDLNLAMKDLDAALNGEVEFKTPNFDLFLLACKVSSKRLFPNFLFLDAPFNKHEKWDINDPDRFKYEVATMG